MKVAIGLGCSLGDRDQALTLAVRHLQHTPGLTLLRTSRWVMTPPMRGGTAVGHFWNGVALFESTLDPLQVLEHCRTLETAAGRRRARHWGDRTLDLDVLLVEGIVMDTPALVLPHPGIASRPFVLEPLLEVWPDAIDPRSGRPWRSVPTSPNPSPVVVGVLARRRWPL